ncbi:DUF1573 domain-containing protein [soil metagenome]
MPPDRFGICAAFRSGTTRKLALLFVPLALVLSLACLARPLPARVQARASWAEIVFPERQHDFGTVAKGTKLRHSFRVVNSTNTDIRITNYKTRCGCTDVRLGAQVIPPGTQTTIEATLDTTQFDKYKPSGLTLEVEGPNRARANVELNLTCFIRAEVTLNPGQVDFGTVGRSSKPQAVAELTYSGRRTDWQLDRSQHASKALTARIEELGRTAQGHVRYRIIAILDPEALEDGRFRDQITLYTNDPEAPQIPVMVTAIVQSSVVVSPAVITVGTLRPGQTIERTILVRSVSNRPFRITGFQTEAGEFLLPELTEGARPLYQLKVALKAPDRAGPHHAVLRIETDVEGEPPAKLSAFATITP